MRYLGILYLKETIEQFPDSRKLTQKLQTDYETDDCKEMAMMMATFRYHLHSSNLL